ncbi:hypothetical protein OAG75_00245 [bacterium]|nr:hypothetical protein [bacterium]
MTRVYEISTEYESGNAKWRALWHDYESHDEASPFRNASTCEPLADHWAPPMCFFANRGYPEPDVFSLVSHYAVNARAKDALSRHLGDAVEFLPLQVFSGVVAPTDVGPILGRIGRILASVKNWCINAQLDNADTYWLLHVLTSVAPDPHRPKKKIDLDFHYDRSQSIAELSAFRVRESSDANANADTQIYVTDSFCDMFRQHGLTGLRFNPVHDTEPAS